MCMSYIHWEILHVSALSTHLAKTNTTAVWSEHGGKRALDWIKSPSKMRRLKLAGILFVCVVCGEWCVESGVCEECHSTVQLTAS